MKMWQVSKKKKKDVISFSVACVVLRARGCIDVGRMEALIDSIAGDSIDRNRTYFSYLN